MQVGCNTEDAWRGDVCVFPQGGVLSVICATAVHPRNKTERVLVMKEYVLFY